jgi:hypothetical protein
MNIESSKSWNKLPSVINQGIDWAISFSVNGLRVPARNCIGFLALDLRNSDRLPDFG